MKSPDVSRVFAAFLSLCSALQCTHAATPPDPMATFEQRGFTVIYRTAEGETLSKAEFDKQKQDRPIAMRVDGDKKTVEITLDGPVPEELARPLETAVGDRLPGHWLIGLDGKPHRWPRDDGKFTLLEFYFSGCGPCLEAIPELNAFKADRPDLAVLAITFDDEAETRRFLEQRKLTWDVVPAARDFIDALGVKVYPTTLLVDAAGKLVAERDAVAANSPLAQETLAAWVDRVMPR